MTDDHAAQAPHEPEASAPDAGVPTGDDRPWDPKTKRTLRVGAIAGGGLGVALALLFGVLGADGRAGFVAFLLGLAFGSALAALYGVGSGAIDTLRGRPVGRSRLYTAMGFFVLSLLCTIMIAGLGG